jgi:hypothetical protein
MGTDGISEFGESPSDIRRGQPGPHGHDELMTDEPVRVRGGIDAPSRWLWLVKWCVLAAPHYPILIGLYLVYPLLTFVAGVAILFTGRYPRPSRPCSSSS